MKGQRLRWPYLTNEDKGFLARMVDAGFSDGNASAFADRLNSLGERVARARFEGRDLDDLKRDTVLAALKDAHQREKHWAGIRMGRNAKRDHEELEQLRFLRDEIARMEAGK